MKVGSTTGDSAGNKRAELSVLIMVFICCMVFSSVLYAQEIAETEIPVTETAAAEENAEPAVNDDAKAATEEAQVDVTSRL
jgi:hypothetical protein